MRFSSITERIGGVGVDAWAVHYEGLARHEAGEDIIILSVGQETEELTPEPIVAAATASLRAGRHHYAPVQGSLALRQAIANQHRQRTGQAVTEANCAVFAGAQNALFAVAQCVLEHGDEVILLEPYYSTYPATVTAAGARVIAVPARPENHFQLDPDEVIAALTDRTRAIVLNSPNNPTGAVYTLEQLRPLVAACVERDIWLISDEVYQEILPPSHRASAANLTGAAQVCITVSSLSKTHRMTGWRLGWVVGPPALIEHLYSLSLCMIYGLPAFIMDAAVVAIESGSATADAVRAGLDRRRRIITEKLGRAPGLGLYSSVGGMFVVLDIRATGVGSIPFCQGLLDAHKVAVLPCDGFGRSGNGLVRVSLCVDDELFALACERIKEYAASLVAGATA